MMSLYTITGIFITLAAGIGFLNHRYFKLHTSIGMLIGAILLTAALILLGEMGLTLESPLQSLLNGIDFHSLVMNGMLGMLLFAGAMNIDIADLKTVKWEIAILSTFGTVISMFIIGYLTYWILPFIGFKLPYLYCLLFGALISPTDPIAVLAIFRQVGAPKVLDSAVAGESLFNDGVGIVIFITLYQLTFSTQALSPYHVMELFAQLAIGGILYGIVIGLIGFWLIRAADESMVEILITLAITTGGYAFANAIHLSGPLAMVVAGLFIGNKGREFTMSVNVRRHLFTFWELVDELLNIILFMLLGLELMVLPTVVDKLLAALIAIPIVLLARTFTVASIISAFKRYKRYPTNTILIMTWGGLRGALAVALALALPASEERSLLLVMTYAVVLFSIVIQGLSIRRFIPQSASSQS